MPSRRIERLNDLIRTELSEIIQRELRDPRLGGLISITGVDVSPDLRHAQVYFSVLGTPEDVKNTQRALQGAAGFLRRKLSDRLDMRRVPDLEFEYDESIARGARISQLLHDTAETGATTGEGNSADGSEDRAAP